MWQEASDNDAFVVSDEVVDLSFRTDCRALPVDHAYALSEQICRLLPWIPDEALAAVHPIHVAASGNGWNRPQESPEALLQISKRTRFYLRVPQHRISDAMQIQGKTINVGSHSVELGQAQIKKLVATTTIFSRSISDDQSLDETAFTQWILAQLAEYGINVKKLLCGLSHSLKTSTGTIKARSVLLADLELAEAIKLQQTGLGQHRQIGCGIFLPHKSLAAVGAGQNQD